MQTDVAVVGGGIAGATAALALGRKGLRVTLIDPGRGHDLNRGDNLWPASVRILDQLAVLPALMAAGAQVASGLEFRHPDLWPLLTMDLERLPGPHNYMINLPHIRLVEQLLAAAQGLGRAQLLLGERVHSLLWEGGRVVGVRLSGGDLRARLVVAADGAYSPVRTALGIPAPMQPYAYSYLVLHGRRPTGYPAPLRTISQLTEWGVVVLVPLPEGRMRLAAAVPEAQVSEWRGLSPEQVQARLVRRQPLLAGVPLQAHGEHYYRLMQMHAERYWAPGAALLGDAAHVTAPFTGQGINLAIQDAAALAERVAPVLTTAAQSDGAGWDPAREGAALDGALAAYEQQRRPANAAAMALSHALAPLALPRTPEEFEATLQEVCRSGPAARAQWGHRLAEAAAGLTGGFATVAPGRIPTNGKG